jgi:serine/threonine-protein kinase RsbT
MDSHIANTKGKVDILDESGLVSVRQQVRQCCQECAFGDTDTTRIVTAASELARNVYKYAKTGEMRWQIFQSNGRKCIELIFEDLGPGIADVNQALQPGFSTSRSLGLGLPGAKRLMDEMEIVSTAGIGTKVTIRKCRV